MRAAYRQLTSQLFSNLYLNDFDHYMKERLGLKHYGRYVDDFYIVHNDPGYLLSLIPAIGRFLRDDAALSLHPDKTKLANVLGGIAFLGSYIKPYRRYVLHRTVFRIREKLDRLDRRPPGYFAEPRRFAACALVGQFLSGDFYPRPYLPAPAGGVPGQRHVPLLPCYAHVAETGARPPLEGDARHRPRPMAGK